MNTVDVILKKITVFCIGVLSLIVLSKACHASSGYCPPTTYPPAEWGSEFVRQTVPARMNAGSSYVVSVTMRNTGTTEWTSSGLYRLGSQSPQDNTIWGLGRVYLNASEIVCPGQEKTFTFTVKAPALGGVYSFQWRMLIEHQMWFGDFSDAMPIVVWSELCPGTFIDPTGNTPSAAAIKACISQTPNEGFLKFPPGTYLVEDQISIDRPITLETSGIEQSINNCEQLVCARLLASSDIQNPPTGGWPGARAVIFISSNNVTLNHIIIDGNRLNRASSWAASRCVIYDPLYGFNVLVYGSDVTFKNSMSTNTLCGSSLAWYANGARVYNSTFSNNGEHTSSGGGWSDGITIDSDNSIIENNHLMDNTDVSMVLMGGENASVKGNLFEQLNKKVFAGLVVFRQLYPDGSSTDDGNYTNTVVRDNLLECHRNCYLGLHIGSRPWEASENARVFGVTVENNTVHDSAFGVSISMAGSLGSPVYVYNNHASGAFYTPFTRLCSNNNHSNGGMNFNISPEGDIAGHSVDSVVVVNGDATIYSHTPMCR